MADISKVRMLNGTEYNYKDAKARSDIEGLKADLDALDGKVLSDDVKTALMNLVSHINAWTDENGQVYVDELGVALGIIHKWDDGYTWLYRPELDGLLSSQSFVTYSATDPSKVTESLSDAGLYIKLVAPATDSGGNVSIFYKYATSGHCRLMCEAKVLNSFYPLENNAYEGGFVLKLSNGTNGSLARIGIKDGNLAVAYYRGTTKVIAVTNFSATEYHAFDLILTPSGHKLMIDNVTVFDESTLSDYYVTSSAIALVAVSKGYTPNDVEVMLKWSALYNLSE